MTQSYKSGTFQQVNPKVHQSGVSSEVTHKVYKNGSWVVVHSNTGATVYDDFEDGADPNWSGDILTTTTDPLVGSRSGDIDGSQINTNPLLTLDPSTSGPVGFNFRVDTLPPTNKGFRWHGDGGGYTFDIGVNPDTNELYYFDGSNTNPFSSFTTGTNYRVELMNPDFSAYTYDIIVDGTTEVTGAAMNTSTATKTIEFECAWQDGEATIDQIEQL